MRKSLIVCAKCGRTTSADEGHALCRGCEGYGGQGSSPERREEGVLREVLESVIGDPEKWALRSALDGACFEAEQHAAALLEARSVARDLAEALEGLRDATGRGDIASLHRSQREADAALVRFRGGSA